MKPSLTFSREAGAGPPLHGGDRSALRQLAKVPEAEWIDLSTGINPWPYPLPEVTEASWRRLPESAAEAAFERAARHYYGAPEAAGLVAAPGSQALIQWLPRLLPARRVAVLGFTYGEHARAWRLAGHRVAVVEDGRPPETAEVIVLVNPNNPDGARHDPERLLALAGQLRRRGGLLVVDEAFADVAPHQSLAAQSGAPGLAVLRSFGKFFGLGGLRLGCLLADPAFADGLKQAIGPWAVSGPALEVATRAYEDAEWIRGTRQRLRAAAARLDRLLAAADLAVVGGTDLYRLASHAEAPRLFERLCRAGLLVRRFPDRPHWLRFGLPPDGDAEARLAEALSGGRQAS